VAHKAIPVHLRRDGGQQNQPTYREKSPLGTVPALDIGQDVLVESLAIIEWLDEKYPSPPLLPADPDGRARVRAIAQTIACDIHPLNNLRVLNYLTRHFGADEAKKNDWYRHWVNEGLLAVEKMLARDTRSGAFCHGDRPGLADCCLVPQVFNARRFDCPLDAMPTICRIVANCEAWPAFQEAAPARQSDAE
jgi:maleylacetoacetate isomerase